METWNEQRLGLFTASEIYKLVQRPRSGDGFSDAGITYIYEVLSEIQTGQPRPEVNSKAIEWGNIYESLAMAFYKNRYDPENKMVYFGKENPKFFSLAPEYNCGSSPDGIVYNEKVIEVKCPEKSANHSRNLLMTLEEFKMERKQYYGQIQLNLVCTGLRKAEFLSFDPRMISEDDKLAILDIPYDEEYVKDMLNRIEKATQILRELYRKRKPLK